MSDKNDLICGVEREVIEKFLNLIKHRYQAADKATFFVETKIGVSNTSGFANTRDIISHLISILNNCSSKEARLVHIAHAEEHLRRAIIEPYATAVNYKYKEVKELYCIYQKDVIPLMEKEPSLKSFPNSTSVTAIFDKVNEYRVQGRTAKTQNAWNEKWEIGVKKFNEAFSLLEGLKIKLEEACCIRDSLIREKNKNQRIIFFLIGVGVTIVLWLLLAY